MNWGRSWGLGIASIVLILSNCVSGSARAQTFDATSWQKLTETGTSTLWVREIRGKHGQLVLTLMHSESRLEYSLTLPCPQSKRSVTYSWRMGDEQSSVKVGCGGKGERIMTEEAEKFFEPLPEEISGHKPAEIFISPERPKLIV